MQIKEIAYYILSVSLAIRVVNGTGIFSLIETMNTNEINQSMSNGISAINESALSSAAATDAISGTALLLQTWAIFQTVMTLVFIPGVWAYGIGIPLYMCVPLQTLVNAIEMWGIMQFVSGRSTKTMD